MRAIVSVRRCLIAAALTAVAATVLGAPTPAAVASGGGGCGRPVTDAGGAAVSIRNFCFGPTVLRTEPGSVVTFRNADRTQHTVLGANGAWGSFETLRRGQEAAYRFVRSGVYPYVCTYHPGMVGVVVVGDARGPGAVGTTTSNGPVVRVSPATATLSHARPGTQPSSAVSIDAWPILTATAFGFLLASLIFLVTRGGSRRTL